MKIIGINGPNLNMLGIREPAICGRETYGDLVKMIEAEAAKLEIDVEFFQANSEGAPIDAIQAALGQADGIINPATALLIKNKAAAISTMAAAFFPMEPINMHFGKTGSSNGEYPGNLLPQTGPRPMQ